MHDRVCQRSDWQITVYIALIGLAGWMDGWMDGWVGGWVVEPV